MSRRSRPRPARRDAEGERGAPFGEDLGEPHPQALALRRGLDPEVADQAAAAEAAVQAGIRFVLAFDWLFVNWLWVADPYRKHGIGSQLMGGAEAAAQAHGCRAAYLDTFTFQAPKFYQRLGYREFGRLDDFPPGHSRIWFSKALRWLDA